jgi:ABC-type Fe3+ transport system permease subunit
MDDMKTDASNNDEQPSCWSSTVQTSNVWISGLTSAVAFAFSTATTEIAAAAFLVADSDHWDFLRWTLLWTEHQDERFAAAFPPDTD